MQSPNCFNLVRLGLAAAVLASHSFALSRGRIDGEPLYTISGGHLNMGTVAVWGFFAVSGYLVSDSWERSPTLASYVLKRALRIYPAFLAASLITTLLVGPALAGNATAYLRSIDPRVMIASLVLGDYFSVAATYPRLLVGGIDGSLWTIHYELVCYLLVAVVGGGWLRRRGWMEGLLLACVISSLLIPVLPTPHLSRRLAEYTNLLVGDVGLLRSLLPFFLTGALLHRYARHVPNSPWLAGVAGVVALASMYAWWASDVIMPVAVGYLVLWTGLHPLRASPADLDVSYGFYVWAFPIQQVIVAAAGGSIAASALTAIAMPATLLVALASWFSVERPAMRFKRVLDAPAPSARTVPPTDRILTP